MTARLGLLLRRLACAVAGHDPSELEAVLYGTEGPICRCCKKELDA